MPLFKFNGLDLYLRPPEHDIDVAAYLAYSFHLVGRQVADRDQNLGDVLFTTNVGDTAIAVKDLEAVNDLVLFHRIVVDKAHGLQVPLGVVLQLAKHHLAAIASSIDQDASSVTRGKRKHLSNDAKR